MQAERHIERSVLLTVALGVFLAQLDGTVINVALPAMARAFNQSRLSTAQLAITAYLVAGVVLLPVFGKAGDRLGRKPIFIAGFAVFGLASALCALATSFKMLVVLRIVQAAGGAMLSGTGLAIVAANSQGRRGHSLGRLSIVYALSGLIGPPVGGVLVQSFGWQSVFWLNVPLAVIGMYVAARRLPADQPAAAGRIDLVGVLLLILAVTAIAAGAGNLDALSLIGRHVAWPAMLACGVLSFTLLLLYEARVRAPDVDPLIDPRLLRRRVYSLGLLSGFLGNGVSVALFVLVPFWLSHGQQVRPALLGVVFLPVALGLGGIAPFAGARADRKGARMLTTLGMTVGAVSSLLLAWQAGSFGWPLLLLAMLGLGLANGLFAAPNNNAVLGAVAATDLAVAGSMLSAARTLGVIAGVSAEGAGFDAARAGHGVNGAAAIVFLLAALLYAANALLCFSTHGKEP